MREWLKGHGYRNGYVSIDNDDYVFSWALQKAKKQKKHINFKNIERLYVEHLIGAVEFYDQLSKETLGYGPKHVLLLHENDSSALFLDAFLTALKKRKWRLISTEEAFNDNLYSENPVNTYSNNGIIAQVAFEKSKIRTSYNKFDELRQKLIQELKIKVIDSSF